MKHGWLLVTYPDGGPRGYGPGGDAVGIAFHDPWLPRRILADADLAMGKAYMVGTLPIADDDPRGFMEIANSATAARADVPAPRWYRALARARRRLDQASGARRARRTVAHHHDLSPALYDLVLDADRQYSGAYFEQPGVSLEEAQAANKRHIAGKLLLEPGLRVLAIGSGWGGLAPTLTREHGARAVGVALSSSPSPGWRPRVSLIGSSSGSWTTAPSWGRSTGSCR